MNLTPQIQGEVARPLGVLEPLIRKDIENGQAAEKAAGMPYYRAAGEKMLEAKVQMKHGEFVPWVKRKFKISKSQAQLYMKLADATSGTQKRADAHPETLEEFRRSLGHHRPTKNRVQRDYQPGIDTVLDRIKIAQLNARRDLLERAEESKVRRNLALQLIDIGFKALASKLHPDKGGSREAMARLNQVRDALKKSAERI